MLTLRSLAGDMGFELQSGAEAAESPLRWVHISELLDPTPWLSGGELLLTTGLQLTTPERQREFCRLLADHQLAGIGFGTGFSHETIPDALLEEARSLGLPVFEVPYELPFIAITEKAFARLLNEQYDVLKRGIALHRRLERLVLEERGLDELVRVLSTETRGTVMVLDSRGTVLAERRYRRALPDDALEALREGVTARAQSAQFDDAGFSPEHPELGGRSLVLPVSAGSRGGPPAWLAASRDSEGIGDFERLILQQAATVVALELMRQRAMTDTERRLAGDVLAEAVTGGLAGSELEARLRPFGIGSRSAVLVFAVDDGQPLEPVLDGWLRAGGTDALVATREGLLCAVVDGSPDLDPVGLAARAREALESSGPAPLRAAASRVGATDSLRRTFHEARCALEAVALSNGEAPEVASFADLGAFQLLLSVQDDDALRLYWESVLGPLQDGGGEYGDELVRSLEAFIEQNGQWEKAARELFCHRHTLRYRIKRVEELTGRDLRSARDRIEFWLALRARELVS